MLITTFARANDFAGEDFSLRFPAALSSFSPYADVAAKGGASAASEFGSSGNPAAAAWTFPAAYDYGASAQFSHLAFQAGTDLDFLSGALTFDAHDFGVIRFAFGQVSSNDHTILASPLVFTYDLDAGRVDWAKRLGAWSLAASFGYSESDTSFRTPAITFADTIRRTSTGRLGVIFEPAPRWLVGVVGEYGYAPTRTDLLTPTALGLVASTNRDITRQAVIRPGVAFQWLPQNPYALLHLDYQYGRFWNETGTFEVNRFSTGVDLPLARFFFLRAGAVADLHGDFGWTAGCGFYPRQGLTFDFAYQNDVFPEIQREFGHSRTVNASVSFQF